MGDNLLVEMRSGRDGLAGAWRVYLPAGSRVLEGFHDPASIVLIGDSGCSDRTAVVDAFTQLWPEALRAVAGLGSETASLVYFSAPATNEDLYDLWPYMPFGIRDQKRFFVSEVCKSSCTRISACGWLCVEFDYESFKRMAGPDGFGFRYGTTIMGVSVREAKVAQYLRLRSLDKDALGGALGDDDVRCWWFCDTDFEGMTLWHKDLSREQLEDHLSRALKGLAERLGLVWKGAQQKETGERPN